MQQGGGQGGRGGARRGRGVAVLALDAFRAVLRRPPLAPGALDGFRRERASHALAPLGTALVEGGVAGIVADRILGGDAFLVAVITAAPMFGNLSSVAWARLAERRRKVPLVVQLHWALAACIAGIALAPADRLGGIALAALVVLARIAVGGLVTVRSVLWTQNYPGAVRARVTSRLTILANLAMTGASVGAGALLDRDAALYPLIYLAGGLATAWGGALYLRFQMRGEEGPAAPPLAVAARAPGSAAAWHVLREDPLYARYLACMFLLGISNMMVEPAIVIAVSRDLHVSYSTGIALTFAMPVALSTLSLPFFAVWIDRVHVARFRSRHSWLWASSQALTGVGLLLGSIAWVGLGRALLGLARGGGGLAWQLGHNDFAPDGRAGLYMGVHATLTGLRGAFAPFLGAFLYVGFAGQGGGAGWQGMGGGLFLLAAAMSSLATLGFAALARRIARAEPRA